MTQRCIIGVFVCYLSMCDGQCMMDRFGPEKDAPPSKRHAARPYAYTVTAAWRCQIDRKRCVITTGTQPLTTPHRSNEWGLAPHQSTTPPPLTVHCNNTAKVEGKKKHHKGTGTHQPAILYSQTTNSSVSPFLFPFRKQEP